MSELFGALAVQSYCFRKIRENAKVADAVREIGLDRIELCGVHCDFNDPSSFEGIVETYRKAGVRIVSLGVERLTGDRETDRKRFEFAKAARCQNMSINFDPSSFDKAHPIAQELAEEYKLKLGIHNHGGYHWLGSRQMLAHVLSLTGDRIGLCLDTAWALQAGEVPEKVIEQFGSRLFAAHLKDFTFKPDGRWTDVVVGTGNLNLEAVKQAGEACGFTGPAIIEYEGDPENPIPAVRSCVQTLHDQGL